MMPNVVPTGTDNIVFSCGILQVYALTCANSFFAILILTKNSLAFEPLDAGILSSQPKGSTWPPKFMNKSHPKKSRGDTPWHGTLPRYFPATIKGPRSIPRSLLETNQPQRLRYQFCILDTSTRTHIKGIAMITVLWISNLPDIHSDNGFDMFKLLLFCAGWDV